MRVFVLMGQFGLATSPGIASLKSRIHDATLHSWDDPAVISEINVTNPTIPISVVGYSLGANQLGWISLFSHRPIELGVAYDPSWLSPTVRREGGQYVQTASKFKKLIVYRNTSAWVWGGSTFIGPNVEEIKVSEFHLGIQFNERLHLKTLAAIDAVRKASQ